MSRSIDERVVKLSFDNKDFEERTKKTQHSLAELGTSLNELGDNPGLGNLSNAANKFSLANVGEQIESIRLKFDLLEMAAIQAFSNILTKGITTGTQLVKSLSIDQVTAGWSKFEVKTRAIQTLMAALPDTGIDEITEEISMLNWYTDETSYSLTDMISNISKFVSQGIDIDTARKAMIGIGNAAAMAGANTSQASHAMEGFSKAIATGKMNKQVWSTWIKTAGLETKAFKEELMASAEAAGTLKKVGDGVYKDTKGTMVNIATFAETLADGWLTSEAILSTLSKYGSDMDAIYEEFNETGRLTSEILGDISEEEETLSIKSFKLAQEAKSLQEAIDSVKDAVSTGWMTTFELLFGNYVEAKTLWTNLANDLYAIFLENRLIGSEERNTILQYWHDGLNLVKDSMRELSEEEEQLLNKRRMTEKVSGYELFNETISGILEVVMQFQEAVRGGFWNALGLDPEDQSSFRTLAVKLISVTKSVRDFVKNLKLSDGEMEKLTKMSQGFFAAIDAVRKVFAKIFDSLSPLKSLFRLVFDNALSIGEAIADWIINFNEMLDSSTAFEKIFSSLKKVISIIAGDIRLVINGIMDFLGLSSEVSETTGEFKLLDAVLSIVSTVLGKIEDIFRKMQSPVKFIGDIIKNNILPAFQTIKQWFRDNIGEFDIAKLFNIYNSALLTGALTFVFNILRKISEIKNPFQSITEFFTKGKFLENVKNLKDSIMEPINAIMSVFNGGLKDDAGNTGFVDNLMTFGKALLLIAGALFAISLVPVDTLWSSVFAIGALLAEMSAVAKFLAKPNSFDKTKGGIAQKIVGADAKGSMKILFGMAAAVLMLASAVKKVASLDVNDAFAGFVMITLLLAEMTAVAKILAKDEKSMMKGMTGLVGFAASIFILVGALKMLTNGMDPDAMLKSFAIISLLIAEAALFAKFTSETKGMLATGAGLIGFGAGILILAGALKVLSTIPGEAIGNTLGILTVALLELIVAINLMKGALSGGVVLALAAAGLLAIAVSMKILSGINTENLSTNILLLGAALLELGIACALLQANLSGAVSLLVAAAAITVLAIGLQMLGSIDIATLGMAVLALAGSLVILGVASAILAPLTPALFAVSGALLVFGIACVAVGAGITALSIGLMMLIQVLAQLVNLIVSAFPTIEGSVFGFGTSLVTHFLKGLFGGEGAILDGIKSLGEKIKGGFRKIFKMDGGESEMEAIGTDAANTVGDQISNGLDQVAEESYASGQNIGGSAVQGINDFLNSNGMDFAGVDGLMTNLQDQLTEKGGTVMAGLDDTLLQAAYEQTGIGTGESGFSLLGTDMTTDVFTGMTNPENMELKTAEFGDNLTSGIGNYLLLGKPESMPRMQGQMIADDIIKGGKDDKAEEINLAVVEVADGALAEGNSKAQEFRSVGQAAAQGFADGILANIGVAVSAASQLGTTALAACKAAIASASPSKKFMEIGKYADQGFAIGMTDNEKLVRDASAEVGESSISSFSNALQHAMDMAETEVDMSPVITPVLDLSQIEASRGTLNGMLSQNGYYSASMIPLWNQGRFGPSSEEMIFNINFDIDNSGKDITDSDIVKWGHMISDQINQDLGMMM